MRCIFVRSSHLATHQLVNLQNGRDHLYTLMFAGEVVMEIRTMKPCYELQLQLSRVEQG